MASSHTVNLGPARVAALNVGTLLADMAGWLRVPRAAWGANAPLFERPIAVPVQSALIWLPGATILVDACDPAGLAELEPTPPGVRRPADLAAQLATLGLRLADVSHVVVTHLHADHYNGLTHAPGGVPVPLFPSARHYLGRADWLAAQPQLADPSTLAYRALAPIVRAGLLELVDDSCAIGSSATILATPGETPGHLAVRVRAAGRSFYALGDLYHHPIEVERPDWLVHWADPVATRASRAGLAAAILAEDATLLATHIAGFGRLRADGERLRWVPA